MADLIDRGVLYKEVEEWEAAAMEAVKKATNVEERKKWVAILQERTAFKYDLEDMPSVDAVPVVRCKDCEYYTAEEKWCRRLALCGAFSGDGFCSFGERRDDATD